jgi:hypothetical protein
VRVIRQYETIAGEQRELTLLASVTVKLLVERGISEADLRDW